MIWPFSTIKRLQQHWASTLNDLDQSVKNFHQLRQICKTQEDVIENLQRDLEVERMRLVACGVGAMANTRSSAAMQRLDKNSPYFCPSVGDVYNAVDREMKLREDLNEANDRAFRASEAHVATMGNFQQALDRIADMVKGDDGQAWKEAEKFLNRHRSTKHCIKCGSKMIELRGEDKKLCSNGACGHEVDWPLEEGQQYMYKRDVEPFVEDRSQQQEPLDPPPSMI